MFVSGLHADFERPTRTAASRLIARRVPIVLINGYAPSVPATLFSNDDVASMELSVSHLVSLGHRRIGLAIGPARYVPSVRKVEGFLRSLTEHLGPVEEVDVVEHTFSTVGGGVAAGSTLLERGCSAIVCGSDLMALGAVRAARISGLAGDPAPRREFVFRPELASSAARPVSPFLADRVRRWCPCRCSHPTRPLPSCSACSRCSTRSSPCEPTLLSWPPRLCPADGRRHWARCPS